MTDANKGFCRYCGASKPPREGEGTCQRCSPGGATDQFLALWTGVIGTALGSIGAERFTNDVIALVRESSKDVLGYDP